MVVPNTIGVVVTEALKILKKPVPLTELITKVASMLECPQQQIADLVTEAVKGGVHYGYIQQSRERYAFFPINLSGLTDDDNLYKSQKMSRNNFKNYSKTTSREYSRYKMSAQLINTQSDLKVTVKRSASACTYNRSKNRDFSPSIQSAPFANVSPTNSKYKSLNSRKDIQETQPKLKAKWRL